MLLISSPFEIWSLSMKNFNFRLTFTFIYQVYEPVEEGSYIKMIDMASGHGGQIQVKAHLFLSPSSP